MKKKLIALLLSVLLVFTFAACSDEKDDPATENGMTNEADAAEEAPEVTIPDAGVNTDEEAVDLGIEVKKSFKMSGTLKKISYKDISESGEKLESMLNATLKKAQLGNFVLAFNDYEDDDAEEDGKVPRAVQARGFLQALRDGAEGGAHHDHVVGADGAGQHQCPNGIHHAQLLDGEVHRHHAAGEKHGEGIIAFGRCFSVQ